MPEQVRGYVINRSILFDNSRGFALAENPKAVEPFVTWQFTQDDNGIRDYYWGHYLPDFDQANADFKTRIYEYMLNYGVKMKSRSSIAVQLAEGAERAAGQEPSDKKQPPKDRGDR